MFRLPISADALRKEIAIHAWPELPFPAAAFTAEPSHDASDSPADAHYNKLLAIDDAAFSKLQGAYITTYEIKEAVHADGLKPTARAVLGKTCPAALVYDTAVARGVAPLGVAPAKQSYKLPGNPVKVYAGPNRPHLQPISIFSP